MPLTLVPTPIGNLEDMSLRALSCIESSELIMCEDTRVSKRLLSLLKERGFLKQYPHEFISYHSHNETKFLSTITPQFFSKNICYMSDAGMPGISDPGVSLINYAKEHNIKIDVLPGANALLLAYVSSGFTLGRFTFHGFLPHKGKERAAQLSTVLKSETDIILYESPHRLEKLINEMEEIDNTREMFLIKEATKKFQTTLWGNATSIKEQFKSIQIKGEWVVIIKGLEKASMVDKELLEMVKGFKMTKKDASKLLAKLSGEHPKYWYDYLLNEEKGV